MRTLLVIAIALSLLLAGCGAAASRQEAPQSIEQYSAAISRDPKDAKALTGRGVAYLTQGDLEKALADLNQALALDPKSARALSARGEVYLKQGEPERALAELDAALQLDGKSADAWTVRGQANAARLSYSAAVTDFSNALQLDGERVAAYAGRGKAYAELGQRDRAITDYTEAIKRAPDVDLYVGRAEAYYFQKDMANARRDLTAAAKLEPKTAAGATMRGRLYATWGEHNSAIADFTKALTMDEKHHLARLARAYSYYELGDKESARKDCLALGGVDVHPDIRGEANRLLARMDQR